MARGFYQANRMTPLVPHPPAPSPPCGEGESARGGQACYTRRCMESGPDLTGALSPDRELARHAAFALYTLLWLEATEAVPRRLGTADQRRRPDADDMAGPEVLAETLRAVVARWPRLFPYFTAPGAGDAVAGFAPEAWRQLFGWMRAQPLAGTEPQALYEIGLMVLGVAFPAVDIATIRDLPVGRRTRVVEWPNAAGYPTLLLATFHPDWFAADRVRLYAQGHEATMLAAWALTLLHGSPNWPTATLTMVADVIAETPDPQAGEWLLHYRLHDSLDERLAHQPAGRVVDV